MPEPGDYILAALATAALTVLFAIVTALTAIHDHYHPDTDQKGK